MEGEFFVRFSPLVCWNDHVYIPIKTFQLLLFKLQLHLIWFFIALQGFSWRVVTRFQLKRLFNGYFFFANTSFTVNCLNFIKIIVIVIYREIRSLINNSYYVIINVNVWWKWVVKYLYFLFNISEIFYKNIELEKIIENYFFIHNFKSCINIAID